MAHQRIKQQRESLARFLAYVLGIRPDEFGLVPDEEGFIPLKELLMALSEEEGWRHIRESHIQDLLRQPGQNNIEIREKSIRLRPEISSLSFGPRTLVIPPKILYCAIRRKTYSVVLDKGLMPTSRPWVTLALNQDLARRIGARRDPEPVLLTILAGQANDRGVSFFRPQELIYLVESLSPDLLVGPPLPKEKAEPERKKKESPVTPQTPGSFQPSPNHIFGPGPVADKSRKKKRGDEPDWKKDARKERRKREW